MNIRRVENIGCSVCGKPCHLQKNNVCLVFTDGANVSVELSSGESAAHPTPSPMKGCIVPLECTDGHHTAFVIGETGATGNAITGVIPTQELLGRSA